jgi:hypothetical protein
MTRTAIAPALAISKQANWPRPPTIEPSRL